MRSQLQWAYVRSVDRDEPIDAIVLAAGASTRMGCWKMLLPWRGATVVEASVAAALEVCSRVLLVVGYRAEELVRLFRAEGRVQPVLNERYDRGQFSSVQAGVRLAATERFFLALGDMPLVSPAIYRRLLEAEPAVAVRPAWKGRVGHPVLVSSELSPMILAEPPESSMRALLDRLAVRDVAIEEPGAYEDIDDPDAYRRLHGTWG